MRNPEIHPQLQRPVALTLALALLLGGCAATQAHPEAAVALPAAEPTACIEKAQIPAEPPMVGQRFNGDAKHDLQVLAPNAKALRDWGQQLHKLLEGCVAKPAETPASAVAKP